MLSLYSTACGFASRPDHVPEAETAFCYCGTYPLYMVEPAESSTHQMCIDGHNVLMGNSGMHGSDHGCPPDYLDQSVEDGADCAAKVECAGPCPCTTPAPTPEAGPITHEISWLAGFNSADARATTAAVGDSLLFQWSGYPSHNVYRMADEAAFNDCDFSGAAYLGDASPIEYTITELPAYFSCSVGQHCRSGQKLAVTEN